MQTYFKIYFSTTVNKTVHQNSLIVQSPFWKLIYSPTASNSVPFTVLDLPLG
jgi:hypothetical protein